MIREVNVKEVHQKRADAAWEKVHGGAEGGGYMAGCQWGVVWFEEWGCLTSWKIAILVIAQKWVFQFMKTSNFCFAGLGWVVNSQASFETFASGKAKCL
jgi:hypothetical protein